MLFAASHHLQNEKKQKNKKQQFDLVWRVCMTALCMSSPQSQRRTIIPADFTPYRLHRIQKSSRNGKAETQTSQRRTARLCKDWPRALKTQRWGENRICARPLQFAYRHNRVEDVLRQHSGVSINIWNWVKLGEMWWRIFFCLVRTNLTGESLMFEQQTPPQLRPTR